MAVEIREIAIRTAIATAQNARQWMALQKAQLNRMRAQLKAEFQRLFARQTTPKR